MAMFRQLTLVYILFMNKGYIYFEIQADDPDRAISFYSQVFGWKFDEVKGLPVPYWRIETGGSRGGLLKRPAKTPPTRAARMPLSVLWKWKTLMRQQG